MDRRVPDNHYGTTLACLRGMAIFWGTINDFWFLSIGSLTVLTHSVYSVYRRGTEPGSQLTIAKPFLSPFMTPKL